MFYLLQDVSMTAVERHEHETIDVLQQLSQAGKNLTGTSIINLAQRMRVT